MKDETEPPGSNVLLALGVYGEASRLRGGQGNTFASEHVVLKRIADAAEAVWIAETHLNTEQRGFRLARPLADASGASSLTGGRRGPACTASIAFTVLRGRGSWRRARNFTKL